MPQTKDKAGALLWRGAAGCDASAAQMDARGGNRRADYRQYFMYAEVIMKVVLIDNAKFISGLLRKLFGIKKLRQTV